MVSRADRRPLLDRADHRGHVGVPETQGLGFAIEGDAGVDLSFNEQNLGTLEKGKLADLVVLSADPLKVSDDELRKLRSVLTLQEGKVVHATAQFAELLADP